jgi:anti-sigma factor RsiW
MNCANTETLIQAGVDGELSLAQRQRLDEHLASCAECRATWEAQRRLSQIADQWVRPTLADDPGDAFTAALMAHIAAQPVVASRRVTDTFGWPLAVLLCLVAAFAWLPFVLLPTVSWLDLSTLALSAQQLLPWLFASFHSLSSDALALTRIPLGFAIPRYAWPVFVLIIALNSAFCVHTRRGQPQRSLS